MRASRTGHKSMKASPSYSKRGMHVHGNVVYKDLSNERKAKLPSSAKKRRYGSVSTRITKKYSSSPHTRTSTRIIQRNVKTGAKIKARSKMHSKYVGRKSSRRR